MTTGRDALRDEIVEALTAPDGGAWWSPRTAADLVLRVVERFAAEQVAAALGDAAMACDLPDAPRAVRPWLAARAAAVLAAPDNDRRQG